MAHQHEIVPAVGSGLFDRKQIGRRLDDTQLAAIALVAAAQAAHGFFRQHTATLAMANRPHGALERSGESAAALAVLVEDVKYHPLRALRAHPREALKCLDELAQQRRVNLGHDARTATSSRRADRGRPRTEDHTS